MLSPLGLAEGRSTLSKYKFLIATVALGLVVAVSVMIHYVRQANAWPSLDDQPPLAVPPVASPTDSWFTLKALMATIPMEHQNRIKEALKEDGLPAEREVWILVTDKLEALSAVVASSPIVSPTREFGSEGSKTSLVPLLSLARGQILRGWNRYGEGDAIEAVEDMLLADRLGQQLVDGSQSLMMSLFGYAIQAEALKELEELLFLAHEPSVHRLVAERLPRQAPKEGGLRAMLLRECADTEALLLDPVQSEAAVREAWGSKSLPGMLYDMDATVAQHRWWCRSAISWAERLPTQRGASPTYLPEGLSEVLPYNGIGIQLLKVVSVEGTLGSLDSLREGQLHREVLRLLTAARLYGFAHAGEPPARADLLVPEYLPSVPLDLFTGKALKIESEEIKSSRGERVWITLPRAPSEP